LEPNFLFSVYNKYLFRPHKNKIIVL